MVAFACLRGLITDPHDDTEEQKGGHRTRPGDADAESADG